ncbi:GL12151 [Drosophila persimilis]|uniref:GL12151 n=1 Tax=Drosophila persimilis TaxID=7234 RepID=B4GMW7_DROPE|nr:GL12151 [Drosophila persimilis]
MPTTCVFQLDRLNPVYNSGEYISGRILLRTDKVKRVNAVYVTLEGEAKVQWTMSGKSETANYSGHQQYLHSRTNVFDNTLFRAGVHVYVLTLRIPPDCPSSCKGPYGYIGLYHLPDHRQALGIRWRSFASPSQLCRHCILTSIQSLRWVP